MMKRSNKPKIKLEKEVKVEEIESDLTSLLHDRVELMHQVFSILKNKEVRAMAPDCIKDLAIDDIQELCLEEVLGISSKRLCAVMDGVKCPSDTNTSSSESSGNDDDDDPRRGQEKKSHQPEQQLETISLDSISSDESIIASKPDPKKKKKSHKSSKKPTDAAKKAVQPKPSTSKKKNTTKKTASLKTTSQQADGSKHKKAAERAGMTVLELLELQARARAIRAQLELEKTPNLKGRDVKSENSKGSDSNKSESESEVEIKEEPQEIVEIVSDEDDDGNHVDTPSNTSESHTLQKPDKQNDKSKTLMVVMPRSSSINQPQQKIKLVRNKIFVSVQNDTPKVADAPKVAEIPKESISEKAVAAIPVQKTAQKNMVKPVKKKRNYRKKIVSRDGDDPDELIMEVSDSEKHDLFESSDEEEAVEETKSPVAEAVPLSTPILETNKDSTNEIINIQDPSKTSVEISSLSLQVIDDEPETVVLDTTMEATRMNNAPVESDIPGAVTESAENITSEATAETVEEHPKNVEENKDDNLETERKSDGELSDAPSSIVEMFEKVPEVLMISDDENDSSVTKKKKKKAKSKKPKEKKHKKKDKGDKATSDFREGSNENFFEKLQAETSTSFDIVTIDDETIKETISTKPNEAESSPDVDFDKVIEILEISDESSSDEVDSGLSKNPTASELIALGIKIEKHIEEEEEKETPQSWKERWLASSKVKKVMTTSSILNALRKKNKELKKAYSEGKNNEEKEKEDANLVETPITVENVPVLEEGTVEMYNTLTGSTEFADPIPVCQPPTMAKDAKNLLKMYKRLLKTHGLYTKEDKKKFKAEKKNLKQMAKGTNTKVTSSGAETAETTNEVPPVSETITTSNILENT